MPMVAFDQERRENQRNLLNLKRREVEVKRLRGALAAMNKAMRRHYNPDKVDDIAEKKLSAVYAIMEGVK